MGAKIVAAVRSIAILVAVWGLLALVGFSTGAFPKRQLDARAGTVTGTPVPDAGVADTGPPDAASEVDASEAPDAAAGETGPSGRSGPLWRALVCPQADTARPGATAALAVGDAVGDEAAEVIVACGGQVDVLGFVDGAPFRVARIGGEPGRAMRPLAGVFSGGTRPDLLAGYAALDAAGNPTHGMLWFFRGLGNGALTEPERLVDAPVVAAALLDGERPGVAAVTWPDAHGVRPSELWLFSGGPSPSRRARVRIGHDGGDVVAFDFDGDGALEVFTVDSGHVRVFDESGTPGDVHSVPGGRRLLAYQEAERRELWVVGDRLHRLRAGVFEVLDGPPGVRSLIAVDVDGDAQRDLVVATRESLMVLREDGEGALRVQPLVTLPTTLRPHDIVGYGNQLLVVAASLHGWELLALPLGPTTVLAEEPEPLADAPLVLRLHAPPQ